MYGLRLFIIVLQELKCWFPSLDQVLFLYIHILVSEIAKYIAWGCLLLFYKNNIVYHDGYRDYFDVFIVEPGFVLMCQRVTRPSMSPS